MVDITLKGSFCLTGVSNHQLCLRYKALEFGIKWKAKQHDSQIMRKEWQKEKYRKLYKS